MQYWHIISVLARAQELRIVLYKYESHEIADIVEVVALFHTQSAAYENLLARWVRHVAPDHEGFGMKIQNCDRTFGRRPFVLRK